MTHGTTDIVRGSTVATMADITEDTTAVSTTLGITVTTHGSTEDGMQDGMTPGTTVDGMQDSAIHSTTTCILITADGTEDGTHITTASISGHRTEDIT